MVKTEWYQHPLVSALMVISDPSMREFAEKAITSFFQQTWPLKELVLINSTGRPVAIHQFVKQFCIKTRFVGEAKNLALYNSEGEWCLPWSEDSSYDSEYIMFHMAQKHNAIPTVMSEVNAHVLKSKTDVLIDDGRFAFSCFPRLMAHLYDRDGSEEAFLSSFAPPRKIKHSKGPLVTRFFQDEC